MVMSHLGRLGGGCQSVVKGLAYGLDESRMSVAIDACYQRLATALQRANVALLASAAPLIP